MAFTDDDLAQLLTDVAARAERAGVFGPVAVRDGVLTAEAANSAEPATYRLRLDEGRLWVELVMEDRWQSESIEADLMHTGDKLEELLEEEMVDLGYDGPALSFEHFRSDDMLFTFRSPLPAGPGGIDADTAAAALLGYEACFRQLGDMDSQGDEDD